MNLKYRQKLPQSHSQISRFTSQPIPHRQRFAFNNDDSLQNFFEDFDQIYTLCENPSKEASDNLLKQNRMNKGVSKKISQDRLGHILQQSIDPNIVRKNNAVSVNAVNLVKKSNERRVAKNRVTQFEKERYRDVIKTKSSVASIKSNQSRKTSKKRMSSSRNSLIYLQKVMTNTNNRSFKWVDSQIYMCPQTLNRKQDEKGSRTSRMQTQKKYKNDNKVQPKYHKNCRDKQIILSMLSKQWV